MLKFSAIISVFTLLALPGMSNAAYDVSWLPPPYPYSISSGNIKDAILNGNIEYALRLVKDKAYQELYKKLSDERQVAELVKKLAEKLEKELNDDAKTNEEKSVAVLQIIEESMEPYKSTPKGEINLSLQHSISSGVTRIEWDKMIEVDVCKSRYIGLECSYDQYGIQQCSYTFKYKDEYVTKIPDYYIYKIVNGNTSLITKINGVRSVSANSISIGSNIDGFKLLKEFYDFKKYDIPNINTDKAFVYDPWSDIKNQGDTVSYRVLTDNAPYRYGDCGTSESYSVTAAFDTNGDGHADFIPDSVYDSYRAQAFSWMVPVLNLLFE